MTSGPIRVCRDARAAHWQLGPLPPERGRLTLIAWPGNIETHDGGVPRDIASVLARSWTAIAYVTFASSQGLITTRQPEIAVQLFEDPGFPWWLQGQVVLLSNLRYDPPEVSEPTVLALLETDWALRATAMPSMGVHGVVRPGVDGDVAGVLTFDDSFDAVMLRSLDLEAREVGRTLSFVTEELL